MTYPVPNSLSPSRVESFTSCPLAFRFASIERLPEPPSVHTTRGSFVHRVLEHLFTRPAADRTLEVARVDHTTTTAEYAEDPEYTLLRLDDAAAAQFQRDTWALTEFPGPIATTAPAFSVQRATQVSSFHEPQIS